VTDDRLSPGSSDSRRTSASLLQRARERNPEAWQRLVTLYDALVRYWCRRAGVATQDIDDVVQEVFVAAFASLDTLRHGGPGESFRGWLHGVTRHRVLDYFRRLRRHIPATGGSDAHDLMLNQPDLQAAPDEEENRLEGELYRRALEFIRGEFEPRTWELFCRSVIDGVSTGAIAAERGVSAAAVRQARSRILRRIREELAGLSLETI
jgi:RNA polymerase sigma-70 factor, ECF subfamily